MVTYRIRFQALALQLHFASFESLDSDECWLWKIILLKSNSYSKPPTTIKFWSFFPQVTVADKVIVSIPY